MSLSAFDKAVSEDLCRGDTLNEIDIEAISRAGLDKRYQIYQNIFQDYSTELVKVRVKESIKSSNTVESTSLTYGEVEFYAFCDILFRLQPKVIKIIM